MMPSRAPRNRAGQQLLPKRYVDEYKRERCAVAIAEVVHAVGPHGLKASLISQKAKIARATFYDIFDGREKAVEWACEFAVGKLLEPVRQAIDEGGSAEERVEGAIGALVAAAAAEPSLAELCLVHATAFFPRRAQRYDQPLVDALAPVLDESRSQSDPDSDTSFGELWAYGILSLVGNRLVEGESDSLLSLAPELTEIGLAPARRKAAGTVAEDG
jgi:AcrR family transcriptional regulator